MDDNKTNSLYEDSAAKEKRFMRFWLIAFVLLYGGGAAIVGAVGWFINIVVVDPMRDRRFRHKMEV